MPIVPIPFSGGAFQSVDKSALSSPDVAIKFENMLLSDAGENVDRPGYTSFAQISGSPVLNHIEFMEFLVVVTEDRKIYSIDIVGAIVDITGAESLGGTLRPQFASDGEFLAIAGGAAPQRWNATGNTELMPGSPPNCSQIVYLDGYWITFLLDDQELRFAGPTAALRIVWNTADFFQAEGLPDNIVSIAVLQRDLFVFGEDSTEVYQNLGFVSVPFQRAFFIDEGTLAQSSVIKVDRTLWFLDEQRRFSFFNGRTPITISTPFDKDVQALGTVSDCFSSYVHISNQYLILFTFPTEGRTFVFDIKSKKYIGEWNGFINGRTRRYVLQSHIFWVSQNKHFIGDYRTGEIHELTFDAKKDGDDIIRRVRSSGEINHGTENLKRNISYRFTVKRGVATAQTPNPVFEIRFRDDGKPWSQPEQVSLGATGDTKSSVRVFNTGLYENREFEVIMTDPVEFNLSRVEENIEPMMR